MADRGDCRMRMKPRACAGVLARLAASERGKENGYGSILWKWVWY